MGTKLLKVLGVDDYLIECNSVYYNVFRWSEVEFNDDSGVTVQWIHSEFIDGGIDLDKGTKRDGLFYDTKFENAIDEQDIAIANYVEPDVAGGVPKSVIDMYVNAVMIGKL